MGLLYGFTLWVYFMGLLYGFTLWVYFTPQALCFKFLIHSVMAQSVPLTQYCSGDKIEKNEMGGACSAYGEEQKRIQGCGGET
jgi:hypothetical protein